ncbi:MAG: Cys-tRNA(Pro) deacylase [Lachnospiraceae bacterium]|nr:Cys-tRNA(Pro) deacylase [Lachnospiraceae bacterium]
MAKNQKSNEEKTNVMRILDGKKINYKSYCYQETGAVSGTEVAAALGQNPKQVFKTLVTVGKSNANYVFVIPVEEELDLKKSASVVGEKKIEMLKSKDLLGLTGYIHGGCSPIGMKKFFRTTIHKTAADFDTIFFSGGKIGYQVEVSLDELKKIIRFELADLTVE